jgi:hypothetical protein
LPENFLEILLSSFYILYKFEVAKIIFLFEIAILKAMGFQGNDVIKITYEKGYEYLLKVLKTHLANPPQKIALFLRTN